LPKIFGDEHALAECLAHLIGNAFEAVQKRDNPKVAVNGKYSGSETGEGIVMLTVRDNGAGIRPDIQEKVFSPFCTTKAKGMGLGLPIAKRTVSDHGGTLTIDSDAQGTAISITLPVEVRRAGL